MDPLFVRILEILLVPYVYRQALWTIAPLIFALVMVQMYFGKYKTEQLGWNTAFGNNISLVWITAILLKYIHDNYGLLIALETPLLRGYIILTLVLGLIMMIIAILDFNHWMPKKLAFVISSSLPTNLLAYFIVVIVVGKVPLDKMTFFASVFIFIFLAIVFSVYRRSITPPKSVMQTIKRHQEERNKKIRQIIVKTKKVLHIDKDKKAVKKLP